MSENKSIKQAVEAIAAADALLITAGAGMGVDSGLPDFRGQHGFWRAYPVLAKRGLAFEEMADPAWFNKDPYLAWAFYGHRLNIYRQTKPHGGFERLLAMGRTKRHGCFVFTSNVDGQFQRAGFAPERIVECHGSIHHFQCQAGCGDAIWDADKEMVVINEEEFRAAEPLPRCRYCGELARPNVLMFGDWAWRAHRTEAQHKRFNRWMAELAQASVKLAVVELGAGGAIPTVRRTSELAANKFGGTLIRINPREYEVSTGQIGLAKGAAEGVEKIWEAFTQASGGS